MNETLRLLAERGSVRAYQKRPIEQDHIQQIKQATLRAPTAGNMMLYSVIEVEDQEKKDQLALLCDNQPMISKAPLVWVFLADYQKWADYFISSGAVDLGLKNNIPHRTPVTGDLFISLCDALVAAQTAVVAAESLGIGSCYIGDILENYESVSEMLNLPKYTFPITLICFGYPKNKPSLERVPRCNADDIFHIDSYHKKNAEELTAMYREMDEKNKNQKRYNSYPGVDNLGQYYYIKKHTSEFMKEMDRSVKEMLKNWG
jgi:FMN reductase (NADPH)